MKYIKILSLIFFLGVLAGLFLYIYPQESKKQKEVVSQNKYEGPIVQKNVVETLPQNASSANASLNATQVKGNRSGSASSKSNQSGRKKASLQIKENILTKYFLQDLSEYILEQFYPPRSKNNPGDRAKTNLNFKSLNARYGLHLTGLRHDSEPRDHARREILNKILQPQRLNSLYSLYADEFLNILQQNAADKEYEFLDKNGGIEKRELDSPHIREMFLLNSKYLRDVAAVYNVLSSEAVSVDLIKKYHRYETFSKYAYLNSTGKKNSSLQIKEVIGNITYNASGKMQDVRKQKGLSTSQYRKVLKNREEVRNKILGHIKRENPELEIGDHEILDICKWVFRRREQGIENSAIIQAGKLLENLSEKMAQRAENLKS